MDLKGIDEKVVEKVGEEGYFTRDKAENKKGEEQFFAQGEEPEVSEPFAGQVDSRERWLADPMAALEEESCLRSCQRPKGCRPRITDEHQERTASDRIPWKFVQSTKGRQAPRNEVLDGLTGAEEGRWQFVYMDGPLDGLSPRSKWSQHCGA